MVDDGSAGLVQAVAGEMYAAQSRRLVRARERVAYGQAALTLKGKVILYRETKAHRNREVGNKTVKSEFVKAKVHV